MSDTRTDHSYREGEPEGLSKDESRLPAARTALVSARSVVAGDRIGRYVLRDLIGAGAMGEVFVAYDPELDRQVALKILRATVSGRSPDANARFQREAQAMARLNHPNVVSVFDVGTVGDRPFVAMELVEGPTLAVWIADGPHPWREVIALFAQAGRGLEAAHAAGIVHRDFKPANVIIGSRVRVADFGLARALLEPSEDMSISPSTVLQSTVTSTGQRVGTPAYMAPEQLAGAPASVASDQYSFAVALHEALVGVRPGYPGPVRPMPKRLAAIIGRALAEKPEDRFSSMTAFIAELERDPGRTRRWALVTIGAALLLTAALVIQHAGSRPVCTGAAARLTGVWDLARHDKLRAAFTASDLPFADNTWRLVSAQIDDYAGKWVEMQTETCVATRVDGRQSESLMDLRTACLERRRSFLAHLTEVWLRGIDAAAAEAAPEAARRLPTLEDCADARRLTEAMPPPNNPVQASLVTLARTHVDQVQALTAAHRWNAARALAAWVRAEAESSSYTPVRAEANYAEGDVLRHLEESEAGPRLLEAARLADAAHDDRLAAQALVDLVRHLSANEASADRALLMADVAEGAIARAGNDEHLLVRLLSNRGVSYYTQGRYDAAYTAFIAAQVHAIVAFGPQDPDVLASRESLINILHGRRDFVAAKRVAEDVLAATIEHFGPDHPRVANVLHMLALVVQNTDDVEVARGYYLRSLAISEKVAGLDAVSLTNTLNNLAVLEEASGRNDQAEVLYTRALSILERHLGSDHARLAGTLENLGIVRGKQRRYDEAMILLQRALKIEIATRGPEYIGIASTYEALAAILETRGDTAGALEYSRRAVALLEKALGPKHLDVLNQQISLAGHLARLGRCGEAQTILASAGERIVEMLGPEHLYVSQVLLASARCDLVAGRPRLAIERLQRGLRIMSQNTVTPADLGYSRWVLAKAFWAASQREAAISTARLAEQELSTEGFGDRDRAAARAFVAAHAH